MSDLSTSYADGDTIHATDIDAWTAAINANTHTKTLYGAFSSRPTFGNVGCRYICTDIGAEYIDTGTAWVKIHVGGVPTGLLADPPSSGWTAVNMLTGVTWAQDKDSMLFTVAANGSGHNWQYQYRSYPGSSFTLTAYLDVDWAANSAPSGSAFMATGLVVSDGTKLITHGPMWLNQTTAPASGVTGWAMATTKWTGVAALSAVYNTTAYPLQWISQLPNWYRLIDNGTNLTWQYSLNGVDWTTTVQEARTTFLTPSRVGVGADNLLGNTALVRLRSWQGVS